MSFPRGVQRALSRAGRCALIAALLGPSVLVAQEERFPGVELGLIYEAAYAPAVALKPFSGRFGGAAVAGQVEGILGRDLRYSDRYLVMDSLPSGLVGGVGIDYGLWDRLGAVWLLSASVEGSGGGGFVVVLELHDVLYSEVKERGRFDIPGPGDQSFRMTVHRISDRVVEWISGEPGMAASRIAFSRRRDDGTSEIYLVDSDGENYRRLTAAAEITMSPAWSPDGGRIAVGRIGIQSGISGIVEVDVATGRETRIEAVRDGLFMSPAYHPDGEVVAFAIQGGTRGGLYTYDVASNCCLVNLTQGRQMDFSPTFSPDGGQVAFTSTRYGTAIPQIFLMPVRGGVPELVSPYRFGEQGFYTSPDWSPLGDLVVFHGRIGRKGNFQILVAEVGDDSRVLQLTSVGNNEDPTWAPDGRHLAFAGERSWGKGLFVVDSATGKIRTVLSGVDLTTPDWSPSLGGS